MGILSGNFLSLGFTKKASGDYSTISPLLHVFWCIL
jgi:hypothetical protein